MILQCRGTDDPSLPVDQQVRPETCWTGSVAERSQITRSDGEATWIHDPVRRPRRQGAALGGMTPFPAKDVCPTADADGLYTHLTPFVAAKGKVYAACDAANMPPEAAVGRGVPARRDRGVQRRGRRRPVQFEVRSDVENESLGCNHKVACTIEVIPINGLSCDQPAVAADAGRRGLPQGRPVPAGLQQLRQPGRRPGRLAGSLWWSASNWKQPDLDPDHLRPAAGHLRRARPAGAHRLLRLRADGQAALQWAPAYCLNKKRFKFQLNQMSDAAGLEPDGERRRGGGVRLVPAPADQRRPDRLRADRRDRVRDRLQHRQARQRGRVHRPQAEPAAGRQAADPVLPRLRPRPRAPRASRQPAGDHERPRVHRRSTRGSARPRRRPAPPCFAVQRLRRHPAAHRLDRARPGRDGLHQRQARPVGDEGQPGYKKIKLPRVGVAAARHLRPDDPEQLPRRPTRTSTSPSSPRRSARCARSPRRCSTAGPTCRPAATSTRSPTPTSWAGSTGSPTAPASCSAWSASATPRATGCTPPPCRPRRAPTSPRTTARSRAAVAMLSSRRKDGKGGARVAVRRCDQATVPAARPVARPTRARWSSTPRRKLSDLAQADANKVALFIRTATTEGQKPGAGNGELPAGFLPIQDSGVDRQALRVRPGGRGRRRGAEPPTPTEEPSPAPDRDRRRCRRSQPATAPGAGDAPGGDVPTTPAGRERRPSAAHGPPSRSPCPRPRPSAPTSATGPCRRCSSSG